MVAQTEPVVLTDGDRLLSVPEVVQTLGSSRATVYELILSGVLPSVKLGRRRMCRHSEIQAFIAGLPG